VLLPILSLVTKRDWHGREHIPRRGGCIIAVNHVSEIDPLTVGHFVVGSGRAPRFLGKVEVFNVPVLGRLIRSAGQIPVYRQTTDAAKAFSAAVEALEAGRCLIFYPEGTITKQPDLWPMVGKTGAARIALTTGCPLIPVAQWGPQDLLAPYARRPNLFPRKVMHITAGPPVDLGDLASQPVTVATLQLATDRLMTAITALLAEIRGEAPPATRFDPRAAGIPRTGRVKDRPAPDRDPL
jgi:1-acyl-sn-glycerol-3-phosphate acyltransferase